MTEFSNIVHDAEEKFPPKPGGMVEQARKEQSYASNVETYVEDRPGYEAVRVDVASPEVMAAQTYIVSTSGNATWRVLGADCRRKRAVIVAWGEPVVVSVNQASAQDSRNVNAGTAGNPAGGFTLYASSTVQSVPLVITGSGEVWVAATSSTAVSVSVWAEFYADTSA